MDLVLLIGRVEISILENYWVTPDTLPLGKMGFLILAELLEMLYGKVATSITVLSIQLGVLVHLSLLQIILPGKVVDLTREFSDQVMDKPTQVGGMENSGVVYSKVNSGMEETFMEVIL